MILLIVPIFLLSFMLFGFYMLFRIEYVHKIRMRWINEDYAIITKELENPNCNYEWSIDYKNKIRTERISYDKMILSLFKFSWPELEIKKEI